MTGVGIGGEYSSVYATIDEIIPKNLRGRISTILISNWFIGSFIAILNSIFIEDYESNYTNSIK